MRLYNYTPSDLVILTNLRRALSYVLCSGWPIRWLEKEKEKEEKEKMNNHVLVIDDARFKVLLKFFTPWILGIILTLFGILDFLTY